MARGRLSQEEVMLLQENPYVQFVSRQRILYTYEFKCLFMEQYLAGKRPVDIFRQAGFDVSVLGEKRIERATARWKSLYAGNGVEGLRSSARQAGSNSRPSQPSQLKSEASAKGEANNAMQASLDAAGLAGGMAEMAEHENRIRHLEKMVMDMSDRFKALESQSVMQAIRTELLAGECTGCGKALSDEKMNFAHLYGLIHEAVEKYPGRVSVKSLCEAFHVPRQGYYEYLKRNFLKKC